ncbi:DUF4332 domain-containing protein [Candidatus Saccharibacteria bacterium]|nr:DUF4332 domain-containing protein [Candidatus Saccharibacteria bacterium]
MVRIKELYALQHGHEQALVNAGIHTTEQLLDAGATATGRMRIADETQLTEEMIKNWVHQSDLLRVEGLSPLNARLLCEIGIYTAPKLAYRTAASVHSELANGTHKVVLPTLQQLEHFIAAAKLLPKVVYH